MMEKHFEFSFWYIDCIGSLSLTIGDHVSSTSRSTATQVTAAPLTKPHTRVIAPSPTPGNCPGFTMKFIHHC